MSAPNGSTKVIVFALFANLGIAICKFTGAIFTKSTSLMAEAIHSLADCTNQVFLLVGAKKSQKPADEKHPLGYGRESFFWSFLVAILLFSMGGLFAIYEGLHKLSDSAQHELTMPWVGIVILVVSIGLEGGSFWACLKEVRRVHPEGSLWDWVRNSTASDLVVIFLEDLAALLGLVMALVFLIISTVTGNPIWDAAGSVVIGVLLIVISAVLAIEVKSLLIGETSATNYKEAVQKHFTAVDSEMKILKFIGLVIGSNEVMVSLKVSAGSQHTSQKLIEAINKVESNVKKQFPEIKWLFVEPDDKE